MVFDNIANNKSNALIGFLFILIIKYYSIYNAFVVRQYVLAHLFRQITRSLLRQQLIFK